jgi:hypothetical protein
MIDDQQLVRFNHASSGIPSSDGKNTFHSRAQRRWDASAPACGRHPRTVAGIARPVDESCARLRPPPSQATLLEKSVTWASFWPKSFVESIIALGPPIPRFGATFSPSRAPTRILLRVVPCRTFPWYLRRYDASAQWGVCRNRCVEIHGREVARPFANVPGRKLTKDGQSAIIAA